MINAAIVGLGSWGRTLVDSVQGKSSTIQFTRGVTRTPAKAEGYARHMGFPLDDDYEAALRDPDIRAVALATPHGQHADQIVAAAAAGKHVFVEKPFTLGKANAERAVEACAKAGTVLALGHNRRFLPAMNALKALIADGGLGAVQHIETNFSGSGALRYMPGGWRADTRESPAGGMGGMGIHMVDSMIDLLGPIERVWCQSWRRSDKASIDDTTAMLFRFKSGASGYLATLAGTARTWDLRVFGDAGSAALPNPRTLVRAPLHGNHETTTYMETDIERAELEAFATAVTGGPVYPLPTDQAIHGIAVFDAIIASAERQAAVTVT